VINWTVVGQLTIHLSSGARPLVYHSDRQVMSTIRFRRAGSLTRADLEINLEVNAGTAR